MATTTQQPQQVPPGAFFRVPGVTARPRRVIEPGPCEQNTSYNLNSGSATNLSFTKFQTLDIDRAFLLELDFSTTYTQGAGETLTVSPASLAAWLQNIQVQFESAYSTFRLPGFLAFPMQQYRSTFAPKNFVSSLVQSGAAPNPTDAFSSTWFDASSPLGTPNFAFTTAGAQQKYSVFVEIPVSFYFDLYWELQSNGQPVGAPIPRAIVSPQRMAATTRNVTPRVTVAPGLSSQPNSPLLGGPVSKVAADTTSTFVGTVDATWWRDCWIPTQSPVTEPPGRMWQYSRDYIAWQTSGAGVAAIPLDDEVPGQGQIMSLILVTYDPALNGGIGGFTPYSAYEYIELLYGSSVQIFQDTPTSNLYTWALQHGATLPNSFFGFDLALTEDGRITNENALNTLVTAGVQARITYVPGSVPSSSATVFVGLEVLKKVGS